MKKLVRKIALVLSCIMMMGLLGGCGEKFDASAYLKALLDNSYKNDSTAIVEMEIATAEEAAALYEEGLQAELDVMLTTAGITEDQIPGIRDIMADMLAGAKYTVGEAVEQEDGSFVVTVTYETMNVFGPTTEKYLADVETMVTEWTEAMLAGEEAASEEEMTAKVYEMFGTTLQEVLANPTYAEPQETTVRIEMVDNMYQPNEDDLYNLEYLLYDSDAE